jgi:hypothetical protein
MPQTTAASRRTRLRALQVGLTTTLPGAGGGLYVSAKRTHRFGGRNFVEHSFDQGLMAVEDGFWRWVRFGKRTHRRGVLRVVSSNSAASGSARTAVNACGYRRTRRGWLSLRSVGSAQSPELRPSGVDKTRRLLGATPAPRNCETNPFSFRAIGDVSILDTETYDVCSCVCKWVRSGKTNPFGGGFVERIRRRQGYGATRCCVQLGRAMGDILMNGAARYINDRHRALQLRHPEEVSQNMCFCETNRIYSASKTACIQLI